MRNAIAGTPVIGGQSGAESGAARKALSALVFVLGVGPFLYGHHPGNECGADYDPGRHGRDGVHGQLPSGFSSGKAIVARSDVTPVSSRISRSMSSPLPPCGGMPDSLAPSKHTP